MVRKKPSKTITRTLSNREHLNNHQLNILRFMTRESKNIYNTSIFHTQIFNRYHNNIFHSIYQLVRSKEITKPKQLDKRVYELYDYYYKHYLLIKPFLKYNNDIIYRFIKNMNERVINDNFDILSSQIIKSLSKNQYLRFPRNCNDFIRKELLDDIVLHILKYMYNGNFHQTLKEIKSRKKCSITNENFIKQVSKNKHLFKEKAIKYKALIKQHKAFANLPKGNSVKSDQNYVARIVYKYYTNPKIPSDLMCNIIKKAHMAYSSYYSLRKKGIKSNTPKFLDYNGTYILPFYARSRKVVTVNKEKYYRLTIGSSVADNYSYIVDDERYICINDKTRNKLYVNRDRLTDVMEDTKINRKNNYVNNDQYISKKSPHIIESYYLYIKQPRILQNKNHKLKLIEISPIYNGRFFKVNYVYSKPTTDNKPIKGKCISVDLGMVNLMSIYDPNGEQFLIKGNNIISMNKFYNHKIDKLKSEFSMHKENKQKNSTNTLLNRLQQEFEYVNNKRDKYQPKRVTKLDANQKRINEQIKAVHEWDINDKLKSTPNEKGLTEQIHTLLKKRENKINDYFNKVVSCISTKYKDCEKIIMGYNEGWKKGVSMGKTNRDFYEIPYRKLIEKLRNKLEEQNQELIIINEAYTSKCDALGLEKVCKHSEYMGKRIKRGLYSSSKGVLLNSDINGAINIMRKWKQEEGKEMREIRGERICNPRRINIYEAKSQ